MVNGNPNRKKILVVHTEKKRTFQKHNDSDQNIIGKPKEKKASEYKKTTNRKHDPFIPISI